MNRISNEPTIRVALVIPVLAILGIITPFLLAQTNYGSVRGRVTDVQGEVISATDISLINTGTELVRSTRTNDSGDYFFTAVDPGTYTVTISRAGFKKVEQKGVIIALGATVTVDEKLEIGTVGETINVSAAEPLIDTATASGGQVFSERQVQDLPNLGRNPFIMDKLDNNVTPVGDPRFVRFEDQNGTASVSVSGAPIGANSYVVDGIPISTSTGGVTFVPSIEATSNVRVQANTYDAELGRTGGGVFNTSLKSGSDTYHGVLFGLTRQTPWAANTWFNNRNGYTDSSGVAHPAPTPRPDFTTYQYAGAFGGPLPFSNKIKYLKNTFFWVTEEGYRQAQPYVSSTTQYYVPTAAERAGDFSADTGFTLYDPTQPFVNGQRTAVLTGTVNGVSKANVIPANYINPIGRSIVNTFPLPSTSQTYDGSHANYFGSDDFKTRGDEYVGKLDHTFAPWWSAAASYVHLATQEPGGDILHTFAASDGVLTRYIDATAVNNVLTLNPTTVLTAGYGFNRYYSTTPQYSNGFDQTSGFGGTGFPAGYVNQLQSKTFPTITLSGVTQAASLGAANSGPTIQTSKNFVVGLTKTIGRQNVKTGYVFRSLTSFSSPETAGNGSFTFNGQYTSQTGAAISNGPNAIADLLLGLPSIASAQINAVGLNMNEHYHAVYVQDDVRVNQKLTANLGIRYEYEQGQDESHNRYTVGFDPNVAYTFPGANGNTAAHGALAFAGLNGYSKHSGDPSHTKLAPRVGVSYEVQPSTVVRAGFGVFYAAIGLTAAPTGFTQTTSYAPGNATGPAAVGSSAYLSNPFNEQLLAPTSTSLGPLTGVGGSVSVPSFGLRYPLVEQYSADIEQQLPDGIVLKIGYVGAHARNFPDPVNINQIPDNVLASYAGGATNLSAKVPNPYYSKTVGGYPSTPFGTIAQPTVARGQTLLPFPQFQAVTVTESVGRSQYNALDLKIQKSFHRGVTALIAYTWSSNWDNLYGSPVAGLNTLNPNPNSSSPGPQDNYNTNAEYARATNDMPNRFTAAVSYDLPIGRGRSILGNTNRWVDALIGGWQINDETIIENGGPLPVVQTNLSAGAFGTTGVGGTNQRPNLVPGVSPCYSGRPQSRLGGSSGLRPYLNLNAFTPALPYTYGNAPRTLNCYGPGFNNSDLSINKSFKVTEKANFQVRAEALNAFNTPEFGQPGNILTFSNSGITSATYTPAASNATTGAVTTQLGFSRIVQLGGRLTF
ncbi:carboxypeptidase-like regulatory domain-containing protein [Granulicella sp. L60]|uniref:TonB-dependent receptor n=1 Tax=Granulicella sp. L60 TaxID=1641866 RepID=UPI00131CC473|nr:carboxypeptidase-like regulatory domain-containing protein [Granulicella sp. L60]